MASFPGFAFDDLTWCSAAAAAPRNVVGSKSEVLACDLACHPYWGLLPACPERGTGESANCTRAAARANDFQCFLVQLPAQKALLVCYSPTTSPRVLLLVFLHLAHPVNGSFYSTSHLIVFQILFLFDSGYSSWLPLYSFLCLHVSTTPKWRFHCLYFQIRMFLSEYVSRTFPFKYPLFLTCTEYFGWNSYQHMYFVVWHYFLLPLLFRFPFLLHNVPSICPTSAFDIFVYYLTTIFGGKTTWYLHSHLVCAKLFLSIWTSCALFVVCWNLHLF